MRDQGKEGNGRLITMTYDQYDELLDLFEKVKAGEKVPTFWPTVEQIDMFEKDPKKWIKFCCYLYEENPAPRTHEEKYSKRNLSGFINRHLELVE